MPMGVFGGSVYEFIAVGTQDADAVRFNDTTLALYQCRTYSAYFGCSRVQKVMHIGLATGMATAIGRFRGKVKGRWFYVTTLHLQRSRFLRCGELTMMAGTNIIVLDNGASTIKAGLANSDYEHPSRIIPNAVVRSKGDKATYIGHEFEQCQDHASLHYRLPFEKINTSESSVLITEPYFNLPNVQEVYDQFMFEEYDFESYYRCAPASLIPHGNLFSEPDLPPAECILIVDSGFSYTHVVPLLHGSVVWRAVKRLDVGGKLLTNHLKELVSFRQWNMMDETYIMNDVKESCCYVSVDFRQDLEACRSAHSRVSFLFTSSRAGQWQCEPAVQFDCP
ncbi:actin [Salix suchowensis]|nr:actin [Salix suchowensis]